VAEIFQGWRGNHAIEVVRFSFGFLGGALGSGLGGAYSNTAQQKVIVAAFTDSYNNVVRVVRGYRAQKVTGGLGKGRKLKMQAD